MPMTQRSKLHLHRDTLRRLGAPDAQRAATDPVSGDTAFCGPSRLSLCEGGCETARV